MTGTGPRRRCGNRAGWLWRAPQGLGETPGPASRAIARPVPKRSATAIALVASCAPAFR